MRRVIALEFVSLDGVIQSPGGPEEDTSGGFAYGGWIAPNDDEVSETVIRRQMNMPFDLLLGRKTFEIWAPFWPHHADEWPGVNAATKYVASNTMTSHDRKLPPRQRFSPGLGGDAATKRAPSAARSNSVGEAVVASTAGESADLYGYPVTGTG
jgi:dihydrofolate reductase